MFQVLPGPPGTRNRTVTQQAQTPALACYTPALRARNRKCGDYAEWLAGIFAQDMPVRPQVSGYPLRPDDPVTADWGVILITSTRADGVFAHATRERDSFQVAICDNRELVLAAARSLIERMQVHDS